MDRSGDARLFGMTPVYVGPMAEDFGGVHYENPFATPAESREPARRLRGRLTLPVTLWTAGAGDSATGLTVSSILVAEGAPSVVVGLLGETTALYDAIHATEAFVVHILERADQALADRFAGLRPSPGGLFNGLDSELSEWGPVLVGAPNRVYCRFRGASEAGHQQLLTGEIEKIDIADLDEPLVYFRGRYRSIGADERR